MNFKIFGISATTLLILGLFLYIGKKWGNQIPLLKSV
jgi:hypothetical protein